MADLPCPLNPYVELQLGTQMNLARVLEIEEHKSSGVCIHPPLKDLVLHGDLEGCTPLLLACGEGHLDSVERIIQHWGADVNADGFYCYLHGVKLKATPLIVASLEGHIEIVRYLISKRADISVTASTEGDGYWDLHYDGLNPLRGALLNGPLGQTFSKESCAQSSVIVWLLLEAGANPNTLDPYGNPMWFMPFCGVEATIALVNHGLNLNQRTSLDRTILRHWMEWDHIYTEQERLNII